MSLAAGVFTFMSAGMSVGDGVYPLTLPEGVAVPALTFRRISDLPLITHDSMQDHPAYTGVRYSRVRLQFECFGSTYDEAEALCDELNSYAVGFRGLWGDEDIDFVTPDTRLDAWDEAPGLWRAIQDLIVGHRTAAGS